MFGLKRRNTLKREVIINCESLETRVAILENGRIEEFQVEHPSEERIVGSIFKGSIQNLEHDLQAAFVDIGLKKNAFLHYWDMFPDEDAALEQEDTRRRRSRRGRVSNQQVEKRFPVGSEIVVQVTKAGIGSKGPRVTANLSLPGRHLVLMPGAKLTGVSRKIADSSERQRLKKILNQLNAPAGAGLIVRTAGSGVSKKSFFRDLRVLEMMWAELQEAVREKKAPACVYKEPDLVERVVRDWLTEDVDRIMVDSREKCERIRELARTISRRTRSRVQLYDGDVPIFDHCMVESQLEEAMRRKVTLPSGGHVVFDETEAMIAVDVNTGRYKGDGSQENAILKVDTEAVQEVARQLRLRNIGGLVVIDLIDMKSKKHRASVYRAMKEALKRDRAKTNVLPISELGILEMTRQRVEESIMSSTYMDCPYCKGRGEVRSPLAMSVEIQRQIAAVLRRRRRQGDGLRELQIIVHPTVLDRLRKEDEEVLVDLQSRFEGRLSFRSDPGRHVESFSIVDPESGSVLYTTVDR